VLGSRGGICTRVGSRVRLGLAVAAFAAPSLQGQGPAEPRGGPSWALRGLRSGQCVRFLIAPSAAAPQLRNGFRPIRADQDRALPPALRGVIEGQPEFGSWTPSSLCFFYLDTVSLGGRTIVAKKGGRPQMIGAWTLAASEPGSGSRRDVVLDLSAGSAQVVRAAEAGKLRVREAGSRTSLMPDSSNEVHEARVGKTRLVWTGRAVGDSARVEQPIEESWLVKGASGTSWNVRFRLAPTWTRPLVGVLSVEGKDDLAKNLKASPIRFVGPRYLGGSADLIFSR
jgi:hypothetical protein